MNHSDSERIAALLERIGYKKTSINSNKIDLLVVNMCSVRQSAVDRVFGLQPKFKKLKINNPDLKTILTGCVLKKDRKKFAEFFDYILNIKNLLNWQKLLKRCSIDSQTEFTELEKDSYFKIQPKYSSYPIAYVPISNGCNNFCAYCVIPYTRGREINRPIDQILCEVKNLVNRKYKEIWLLGQNVTSFQNNKINFSKLLKMVNDIRGKFWLRFTSSHPKDFSNELIKVMAECEKITPYLNLPVQSGDNETLRKMNRNYAIEDYKKIVRKIREKIPEITLSTDVIVGFPGETKSQFENTMKLFQEIKFDMAYIAQYSPRPGTLASEMKDNVPKEEKQKREKILTEILKKTASQKNKKFVGKTMEVLPVDYKNGLILAKSFNYKTVKFKGRKELIGKFTKVKIIDASAWGLEGKLV